MTRTDAYMRAYGGSKRRIANCNAYRLMTNPRIRKRVDELMNDIYNTWVEQTLPFTRLIKKVRDVVEDDDHRAPQIRAIELALKVRQQYLFKQQQDDKYAKMSDEELIKSVQALGWQYVGEQGNSKNLDR